MDYETPRLASSLPQAPLSSTDIVNGLGVAEREFLAACLALFEDSTLNNRISTLWYRITGGQKNKGESIGDLEATATAVKDTATRLIQSEWSDDDLRVSLWVYLREAFGLPAHTFASVRTASTAADDLVARAISTRQPSRWEKIAATVRKRPERIPIEDLDTLSYWVLDELIQAVIQGGDSASAKVREKLFADIRQRLRNLPAQDRQRLLDAVGADDINDEALKKILLTGGGLAALGTSVSIAGFSAYILAAQVSAFIPLVSGPGLVSFLAVLSNPITIAAATVGVAWWAARSAREAIALEIGVRVLSLLALQSPRSGDKGTRVMVDAFDRLEVLHGGERYGEEVFQQYRLDWAIIRAVRCKADRLDPTVAEIMDRPAAFVHADATGAAGADTSFSEQRNAAILGGLTLGDVAYHAFSLNPSVVEAADFSRSADLADPTAFAQFAHRIEQMDPQAYDGAISNLKGYVAERFVASQLVSQGHLVEFAPESNSAGWDLKIDGIAFQVKDRMNLSGIKDHFEAGYDYPVIVNSELAGQLAALASIDAPEWLDRVHFVEGYSNELVETITRDTLAAGAGMFNPDVPVFAVAVSAFRNYRRLNRGEVTSTQAFQDILLDGSVRAGLAVLGGYVGTGVGLVVFGPAGGLVLSAVVPVLTQMQTTRVRELLDKWTGTDAYRDWSRDAAHALDRLIERLMAQLQSKADLVKARQVADDGDVVRHYVNARLHDELDHLREAYCRLSAIQNDEKASIEIKAVRVIAWVSRSTLHPVVYQTQMRAVGDVFKRRPSISDWFGIRVGKPTGEQPETP
jgi:hypothetical protein